MSKTDSKRYHSLLFAPALKVLVTMFGIVALAGLSVRQEIPPQGAPLGSADNVRRPSNDDDLRYWLENMVWYPGSSPPGRVVTAPGATRTAPAFTRTRCFPI